MIDTPTPAVEADKLKTPLDTATALALGVWTLMVICVVGAWFTGDADTAKELSKNYVGPGFLIILGYYFGSASSSKRKDETIAAQAATISDASK